MVCAPSNSRAIQPKTKSFKAAYLAAVKGRPAPVPAAVVQLPTASPPRSFKAAWRLLRTEDPKWKALGPDIKTAQTRIAEHFLTMEVVERGGGPIR